MNEAGSHRVGQIALHLGYITPDGLEECLRIQETTDPSRTLGEILVAKRYLTEQQLASVIDIQTARLKALFIDPARGGLFGQIALRLGYINPPQLRECLREQEAGAGGRSSLRLGQLLLRKRYLRVSQFLDVLRQQSKEAVKCPACDAFYDAHQEVGDLQFLCSRCGAVVEVPLRKS